MIKFEKQDCVSGMIQGTKKKEKKRKSSPLAGMIPLVSEAVVIEPIDLDCLTKQDEQLS